MEPNPKLHPEALALAAHFAAKAGQSLSTLADDVRRAFPALADMIHNSAVLEIQKIDLKGIDSHIPFDYLRRQTPALLRMIERRNRFAKNAARLDVWNISSERKRAKRSGWRRARWREQRRIDKHPGSYPKPDGGNKGGLINTLDHTRNGNRLWIFRGGPASSWRAEGTWQNRFLKD